MNVGMSRRSMFSVARVGWRTTNRIVEAMMKRSALNARGEKSRRATLTTEKFVPQMRTSTRIARSGDIGGRAVVDGEVDGDGDRVAGVSGTGPR